jgi:nucleotide-binding universal stress UspA family protein
MDLKDILVCLDPTDAGETRLKLAAALALDHHAHLTAAYLLTEQIPGAAGYDGIGMHAPAETAAVAPGSLIGGIPAPGTSPAPEGDATRAMELADIIEQRFREAVQPDALQGDWHVFEAGEARDLVDLASAVDLIVFGQQADDYRLPTGFGVDDLLIDSGRPMLVVPHAGQFGAVARTALVAWDGTPEASRALHAALPLLAKAEAAVLVSVLTGEQDAHSIALLDRLVRHLRHHGVRARAEPAPRGALSVADVLLSRAGDLGADLIVAGAYHHSPLREALLGGVSSELLGHATVPVLMSH